MKITTQWLSESFANAVVTIWPDRYFVIYELVCTWSDPIVISFYDFAIRFRGVDNSVGAYSDTVSVTPNYIGPDWYVSTSGSDDTGDGSSSAPFSTISAAYTAAAAGDTIILQSYLDSK